MCHDASLSQQACCVKQDCISAIDLQEGTATASEAVPDVVGPEGKREGGIGFSQVVMDVSMLSVPAHRQQNDIESGLGLFKHCMPADG